MTFLKIADVLPLHVLSQPTSGKQWSRTTYGRNIRRWIVEISSCNQLRSAGRISHVCLRTSVQGTRWPGPGVPAGSRTGRVS